MAPGSFCSKLLDAMRALVFDQFGDFSHLKVRDLPNPQPLAGEILVKVSAASINPSDAKNVLGKMEGTTLPRIPGRDFAGTVVNGPPRLIGKQVWGAGGDIGFTRDGCHAEFIAVPEDGVSQKPANLEFAQAAAVGVNYTTAWLGLVDTARLQPGETLVVTGAMGGVGSSAVKIARWMGARVIAVTRDRAPQSWIDEFGIALAVSSQYDDIAKTIREFTDGRGANVVMDCVGGQLFESAMNCLGLLGRHVCITSVGSRRVQFDLLDFYHRRLTLMGVDTRALDTVGGAKILEKLRPAFESGIFAPPTIERTCTLTEAPAAYAEVAAGEAQGKIVITF